MATRAPIAATERRTPDPLPNAVPAAINTPVAGAASSLVVSEEPRGLSPTGRPWMALTRDLRGADDLAWCIAEARRIARIPGRAALVWRRDGRVTVYVDRVAGVPVAEEDTCGKS